MLTPDDSSSGIPHTIRVGCARLVANPWFERVIIGLIILNAVVLGLETSEDLVQRYGSLMLDLNHLVLGVFVFEVVVKIVAVAPHFGRYFGSGWNLFDFTVVALSLVPATGEYAMIARLARLLRVLRLISTLPELRLIVTTLVRSIPGMANVLLLLAIIFYMYAVAGYHLLHEHDPEHWRTLGMSLLTLFRVMTLEDWTDVMYTAMQMHPAMWVYFVSFVVCATLVVINLFIAVVINNLEAAKLEQLDKAAAAVTPLEIKRQIVQVHDTLERLEARLAVAPQDQGVAPVSARGRDTREPG